MLSYFINVVKDLASLPFVYKNYWIAYADYFRLIRNRVITYRLRDGSLFKARAGMFDVAMITEVLGSELYCYPSNDIHIRANDIVVDVGAFIGDFSVYAARKSDNVKVYALEPSRSSFDLLQQNITLNKINHSISAFNKGLAGTTSTLELYFPSKAEHSNTTSFELIGDSSAQRYEIECIGVNDFLKTLPSPINYFKVDCEGAEYGIFEKISDIYLSNMRCIVIEYHLPINQPNDSRLINLIERLEPIFKIIKRPQVASGNLLIGMLYCRNKNIA